MKIKRGFTFVGGARKFRVYVNDELVGNLKLSSEIEVEQPKESFTLYFETMRFEKSHKCVITSDEPVRVVANVNPIIRVALAMITALLFILISFRSELTSTAKIIILSPIFLFFLFYYLVFKNNYLIFKVYDQENILLPIEKVDKSTVNNV